MVVWAFVVVAEPPPLELEDGGVELEELDFGALLFCATGALLALGVPMLLLAIGAAEGVPPLDDGTGVAAGVPLLLGLDVYDWPATPDAADCTVVVP